MSAADIRFYAAIFLRWLPLALLMTCLTTAIGGYVAYILPPVYTSTATIVVEAPDLPTQLARSTVPQNAIAQVQLVREQLMTDASLEAMAEELKLRPRHVGATEELVESMRANTKFDQIKFGSGDQVINAFTVSFSASEPAIAAQVANRFATLILANDLSNRQQRAAAALTFFQNDVSTLGTALQTSEQALLTFRSNNIAALPESLAFRRAQIATGQATIAALQEEAATARLRRAGVLSDLGMRDQGSSGLPTLEATKVAELKATLATQLGMFTEDSPSVVRLRERIRAVEQGTSVSEDEDAAPQSMPAEVLEIDARLAEIEAQKAVLQASQANLEASLLATPANESSLRALELERDNVQSQYTAAVARLAEASTGERVETLLKGERLALFEEALPPEYPVRPQRRIIVAIGAVAGFGAIIALAIMLELLNAKIRRPADLQRKLSIEPLGVIPMFQPTRPNSPKAPRRAPFSLFAKSKTMPINGRPSWTI